MMPIITSVRNFAAGGGGRKSEGKSAPILKKEGRVVVVPPSPPPRRRRIPFRKGILFTDLLTPPRQSAAEDFGFVSAGGGVLECVPVT